jgi:hypothetical protein
LLALGGLAGVVAELLMAGGEIISACRGRSLRPQLEVER